MDAPMHRRPSRTNHRGPLPDGPTTVHAAQASGWTRSAQRHGVRAGDLQRLQRGVIGRAATYPPGTPARRVLEARNLRTAQAAALMSPRAAISHLSGAIAHGMPTFGPLDRSCLTVTSGTALRRLAHVHLHRATTTDSDRVELDGYPVLGAARTVMDVAREFGVDAGVVAADFALHERLIGERELREAFEVCRGWPGRKAARLTLLSADAAAESPLESVSRLRIRSAGLPAPSLQAEICDADGRFLGRCDFYWDEYGVFGEADGDLKYERDDGAVLSAQRERQGALESTGLIGVRWGWPDLFEFGVVSRRLTMAFARGARRGSAQRRWGVLLPQPTPALHS